MVVGPRRQAKLQEDVASATGPSRAAPRFEDAESTWNPEGDVDALDAELTIAGSPARDVGLGDGFVNHPSEPSGSFTGVTVKHDCTRMSALRFLLPSTDTELLDVRDREPLDQPLSGDASAAPPVSDG